MKKDVCLEMLVTFRVLVDDENIPDEPELISLAHKQLDRYIKLFNEDNFCITKAELVGTLVEDVE